MNQAQFSETCFRVVSPELVGYRNLICPQILEAAERSCPTEGEVRARLTR